MSHTATTATNPAQHHPGSLRAQALSYQTAGARLLHEVSIACLPGRVTALLGPNGAGKSTLLSVLAGQRRPTAGQVWLGERPLPSWRGEELARIRAIMPQQHAVAFDFCVHDIVALGRYPHRLQPAANEAHIVPAALALCDIAHLADRAYASLSGGEQARVQLARVLAQLWCPPASGLPRWLLLDEPTAALDWAHQMQLLHTVRDWAHAQGVGVVAVLHDLNLALRYADDALILQQGRIVAQGLCSEILTPEQVQAVWQVQCQRLDLGDAILRLVA